MAFGARRLQSARQTSYPRHEGGTGGLRSGGVLALSVRLACNFSQSRSSHGCWQLSSADIYSLRGRTQLVLIARCSVTVSNFVT